MSLVAYDSSASEDEQNEEPDRNADTNNISDTANGAEVVIQSVNNSTTSSHAEAAPSELFTNLPQPRANIANVIEEEQDEFLQKKEVPAEKPQKRIKIDVPALNTYESDDDEPSNKKPKPQVKDSGLFALLPAPKVTPLKNTSFVPNVLQKKTNPPAPRKSKKVPVITKVGETEAAIPKETITIDDSDSNDEDDIETPETFDDETWQKVCGKRKRMAVPTKQNAPATYQEPVHNVEAAPDVSQPYEGLDNQAFKELVGNKKKEHIINLIDIHEDEIRPDKEEWLKSLTDPNFEPESEVKDPVDNTRKVKNHITALAQKALANDKELQLRWAESRHNRKQAAAKYGF